MKFNFSQVHSIYTTLENMASQKLPFKLSLLISRNLALFKTEEDFYIEQERKFVQDYLEINEETGELVPAENSGFKIKEGKVEECMTARQELDAFEVEIEAHKIPASALEKMEFTPAELVTLECLIDEEA